MTNGEKIQAVFPDIEMWGESKDTLDYSLGGMIHRVTKSWWNAEYIESPIQERQAESDKFDAAFQDGYNNGYAQARFDYEQEPTTKNDLGVDCVARQDVERYIEGFINEYTPREELEFINLELDGLKHIPSVTQQEFILDKIRAEIKALSPEPTAYDVVDGNPIKDAVWETLADVLQIIDKNKAESEEV